MQNKNLYSLSFLRIIFMFLIFLEHYPETFLRVGGKAVCFFFILSGFVLSYGYGNKIDNGNITYKNFLTGRMVKLYPLHWLLLPIGYWITRNVFSETCYFLPANILLLQSLIPNPLSYYSGNGVSWFLSTLLFLYIAFPFTWKYCSRLSTRQILLAYIVFIAVRCGLDFICTDKAKIDWLYINPLCRWLDFSVGIITFLMYRTIKEKAYCNKKLLSAFVLSSLILTFIVFYTTHGKTYYLPTFWIVYSLLITSSTLMETSYVCHFRKNHPKLANILTTLSNISFSFYMLHQIIILILYNHPPVNSIASGSIKFFSVLTICLFAAYLSQKYFEKPVAKYLSTRIVKTKQKK